MIHQGQYVKDGEYILWSLSLLEEATTTIETPAIRIETMCLDCGAINVGDDHECERRVA